MCFAFSHSSFSIFVMPNIHESHNLGLYFNLEMVHIQSSMFDGTHKYYIDVKVTYRIGLFVDELEGGF